LVSITTPSSQRSPLSGGESVDQLEGIVSSGGADG
jgi:hypothetical protein